MGEQVNALCAVLVGQAASDIDAEGIAANTQGCPYVALYATSDRLVTGIFVLPRDKQWWIELPQERPELLGLESVQVFIADRLEASSPWSAGSVEPELPIAPCGAGCGQCPHYRTRCDGCPATVFAAGAA